MSKIKKTIDEKLLEAATPSAEFIPDEEIYDLDEISLRDIRKGIKRKVWEAVNVENPSIHVLDLACKVFGLTMERAKKKSKEDISDYDKQILAEYNKNGGGEDGD